MALDGRRQGSLVLETANKVAELRVPDKRVAANRLVVRCGPVNEEIGLGQSEGALGVFGALPLHAVLGRDLAKVLLDDGGALTL